MNNMHTQEGNKKRYHWVLLAALLFAVALVYACTRPEPASPDPLPDGNAAMREVQVYFTNSVFDPEFTCTKVFPVPRYVPAGAEPMRAAIEELLIGPTVSESMQSYQTSLNPGTELMSIIETDTTVQLDFNEQLDFQVGGSCRVAAIWSQITQTAKQFAPQKEIVLSINGETEEILQP